MLEVIGQATRQGMSLETRRPSVLVVDDEPMMGTTLRLALEDDFDVTVTESAEDAKGLLENRVFDAVLCDLMMPATDGISLHEWVRDRDALLAARMVFMTGGSYTERSRKFLDTPGRLRIEKPFAIDALLELLKRTTTKSQS